MSSSNKNKIAGSEHGPGKITGMRAWSRFNSNRLMPSEGVEAQHLRGSFFSLPCFDTEDAAASNLSPWSLILIWKKKF